MLRAAACRHAAVGRSVKLAERVCRQRIWCSLARASHAWRRGAAARRAEVAHMQRLDKAWRSWHCARRVRMLRAHLAGWAAVARRAAALRSSEAVVTRQRERRACCAAFVAWRSAVVERRARLARVLHAWRALHPLQELQLERAVQFRTQHVLWAWRQQVRVLPGVSQTAMANADRSKCCRQAGLLSWSCSCDAMLCECVAVRSAASYTASHSRLKPVRRIWSVQSSCVQLSRAQPSNVHCAAGTRVLPTRRGSASSMLRCSPASRPRPRRQWRACCSDGARGRCGAHGTSASCAWSLVAAASVRQVDPDLTTLQSCARGGARPPAAAGGGAAVAAGGGAEPRRQGAAPCPCRHQRKARL